MPFKLSVTLWTVYGNLPFEQRLEKMAEAGYEWVEIGAEYEGWSDEEFRRANNKKRSLKIEFDAMGGMRHVLGDSGFLANLRDSLPIADKLECGTIIALTGRRNEAVSHAAQHETCVEALKQADHIMAKHRSTLLLESLDPEESPNNFLNSVTEGFEIVRKVDNPHVRFLYDLYHEQIAAGNLIEKLEKNIDYVNLVHVAGVPGRNELDTGEINYPNILRKLTKLKYNRYVAMEFLPSGDPVESLRAAREMAIRAANGQPVRCNPQQSRNVGTTARLPTFQAHSWMNFNDYDRHVHREKIPQISGCWCFYCGAVCFPGRRKSSSGQACGKSGRRGAVPEIDSGAAGLDCVRRLSGK